MRRTLCITLLGLTTALFLLGAQEIGRSVEGRRISLERVGEGERSILLIGGIHGGYEWNSILLARELLAHYRRNPEALEPFELLVVENMNPDGLFRVTGGVPIADFDFAEANTVPGRFNARWVDLNRNWDSDWQPTSYWGSREVDAGSAPFSEPETRAIRDLILAEEPAVVVFLQSAAAGLWYSGAREEWQPALRLAGAYSRGSGYPLPTGGDGPIDYEITGAASGYLRKLEIPTVVVELTTHEDTELARNIAGMEALLAELRRR